MNIGLCEGNRNTRFVFSVMTWSGKLQVPVIVVVLVPVIPWRTLLNHLIVSIVEAPLLHSYIGKTNWRTWAQSYHRTQVLQRLRNFTMWNLSGCFTAELQTRFRKHLLCVSVCFPQQVFYVQNQCWRLHSLLLITRLPLRRPSQVHSNSQTSFETSTFSE